MSKYDFLDQKENEEVVLVVRQHYWTFFSTIAFIGLIAITYFLILWKLGAGEISSWATVIVLALIIYIIIRSWFVWNNQTYIITSDRVISTEQSGWFNHSVSESTLENILFINNEIKGPVKTLFNFGNVRIRASGVVEDELLFKNVADPYNIQQIIVKAQKQKSSGSREDQDNTQINKTVLR